MQYGICVALVDKSKALKPKCLSTPFASMKTTKTPIRSFCRHSSRLATLHVYGHQLCRATVIQNNVVVSVVTCCDTRRTSDSWTEESLPHYRGYSTLCIPDPRLCGSINISARPEGVPAEELCQEDIKLSGTSGRSGREIRPQLNGRRINQL